MIVTVTAFLPARGRDSGVCWLFCDKPPSQNSQPCTVLLSHKLSEYHSGYRGFTCQVLKDPPLTHNLDDFLFDNEMLSQAILPGFRISELSCALRSFPEAYRNFRRSGCGYCGLLNYDIARNR